jgi:hypothetical protein
MAVRGQICYTARLASNAKAFLDGMVLRMAAFRTAWVGFTRCRKSIAETIGSPPSLAESVVCTLF